MIWYVSHMNPVLLNLIHRQHQATAYRHEMPRRIPPSAYLEPGKSTAPRRPEVNLFGTPRARTWRIPQGGTESGLRGAQLQHQISRRLRDAITVSDYGTARALAREHDLITYDRLRGVLSGDVWMRLEDVAGLAYLLGLEPVFALESLSEVGEA